MRQLRWLCGVTLCCALVSIAGTSAGQDKGDANAKSAEVPSGFRMYLVADGRFPAKDDRNREGKLHDPVTEYGLGTVIAVIVRGVPKDGADPVVAVMKKQQELAAKYRMQRLGAWVAFLALSKDFPADDDRDKRIQETHTLAKAADVPLLSIGVSEATVAAGDGAKEGATQAPKQVKEWQIGPDDAVTIVVYHRFKIVKRWKFTADKPPGEADLKDLADVVDTLMKKKTLVGKK